MNRNIGIDIIRGVSALLIVAYHYTCHYNLSTYTEAGRTEWSFVVSWGCLAVITFFMISGYLSSSKLKKDAVPSVLLKKRFLRLYPTFWAAMIVTLIITVVARYDNYTVKDVLLNLTMLPSLFGAKPIDGVYWTQQYEVLFYIILVGIVCLRLTKRVLWVAMLWVLLSIALYFVQLKMTNPLISFCRVMAIPQYCSAFIAGMMIRNLVGRQSVIPSVIIVFLCGVNILLWHSIGSLLFFVVSFVALFVAINTPPLPRKIVKPLSPILFVSSISYPLYLVHQKIGYVIILHLVTVTQWDSEWILLIPLFVVIPLAWCLHKYVEIKF